MSYAPRPCARSREREAHVSPKKLWLFGFVGFLGVVHADLAVLRAFFLLFLVPLLTDLLSVFTRAVKDGPRRDPLYELPLPGPAGGAFLFALRYFVSSTLALANPWQLVQSIKQTVGQIRVERRIDEGRDVPIYAQKVCYTVPFGEPSRGGDWFVSNGGVSRETSHSWHLLGQRYAYDFVVVDRAGLRHVRQGRAADDYYAYGESVLAPADGEVVHVRDGVRDAPMVGTGWVDWTSRDFRGNFITIRHAEGEYSVCAHLIPGSIRLLPGDPVRRGDEIGRCGNSGHSTEPHLHFQVQDHPDFFEAAGLPIKFSCVTLPGDDTQQPRYLERGMRVHPAARAATDVEPEGRHDRSGGLGAVLRRPSTSSRTPPDEPR
jgi:hypothetical protein